jgi:hypothetical protein
MTEARIKAMNEAGLQELQIPSENLPSTERSRGDF